MTRTGPECEPAGNHLTDGEKRKFHKIAADFVTGLPIETLEAMLEILKKPANSTEAKWKQIGDAARVNLQEGKI